MMGIMTVSEDLGYYGTFNIRKAWTASLWVVGQGAQGELPKNIVFALDAIYLQ